MKIVTKALTSIALFSALSGAAFVIATDVDASNGVVHVIDRVIIPS